MPGSSPAAELDLAGWDIAQLQDRYRHSGLRCADVVGEYLRRIAALDGGPVDSILVAVNGRALRTAHRLDEHLRETGTLVGPLHGVPVVVKDQFETEELPTRFGSALIPPRPAPDAIAVARLRRAGAIVLAKGAMADFGLSLFSRSSLSGSVANPYDGERDIGGSSSGSAAAVALELCLAALAEDSAGSIRIPASFAGLVGLRPTTGLVSTAGASPLLASQDSPGPITRCVRDAALLLDALAGTADAPDPGFGRALETASLRGVRIGVLRLPLRSDLDRDATQVESLMAAAMVRLARGGAELTAVLGPRRSRRAPAAGPSITAALAAFLAQRPEYAGLDCARLRGVADGADLLGLLAGTGDRPGGGLAEAMNRLLTHRARARQSLVATMRRNGVQALCYPTALLPAPRSAQLAAGRWTSGTFPALTSLAAQAGAPAITVPAGFTDGGLPVGLEFLALPYADADLLRIAYCYERLTGHRRPPPAAATAGGGAHRSPVTR